MECADGRVWNSGGPGLLRPPPRPSESDPGAQTAAASTKHWGLWCHEAGMVLEYGQNEAQDSVTQSTARATRVRATGIESTLGSGIESSKT